MRTILSKEKNMWLTPKQAMALAGLKRHQLAQLRKRGEVITRPWRNKWLYDVAGIYRISEVAREVLGELMRFSERTESGRHFTEEFRFWRVLEECGWIVVWLPANHPIGLRYDMRYYRASISDEGRELAQYISELDEQQ